MQGLENQQNNLEGDSFPNKKPVEQVEYADGVKFLCELQSSVASAVCWFQCQADL